MSRIARGPGPATDVRPTLYERVAPELPADYAPRKDIRPIRLEEIDLYVTMNCNLRCQFCSVHAGEYDHDDMSLDRLLSLIAEAAELGLKELHFLGGEPTLRDDLEQMILFADERAISTRVITNGLALDHSRLSRMKAAGLNEVMVSIDGMEASHNCLRLSGSKGWERAIDTVTMARSLDLRTRVAMTAYDDNMADVLPLMRLTSEIGATTFSVFLGSPLGRGQSMVRGVIRPHRWRELQVAVAAALRDVRPDLNVIMEQGFAWRGGPPVDRSVIKGRGTGCNTLLEDFDYLIVRSDGNLYQCVFFMNEGTPLGNVRRQPLERTLQFALERRDYAAFTRPNDRCVTCFHQQDCGTGCRGYAQLIKRDWLKTDPRCAKAEPTSEVQPEYFPLCPILKWNARTGSYGGSSEQALAR
jgi:radical SAM protein with 4Fe4S-binding SPASM domain